MTSILLLTIFFYRLLPFGSFLKSSGLNVLRFEEVLYKSPNQRLVSVDEISLIHLMFPRKESGAMLSAHSKAILSDHLPDGIICQFKTVVAKRLETFVSAPIAYLIDQSLTWGGDFMYSEQKYLPGISSHENRGLSVIGPNFVLHEWSITKSIKVHSRAEHTTILRCCTNCVGLNYLPDFHPILEEEWLWLTIVVSWIFKTFFYCYN